MGKGPCLFKATDITRALKAMEKAGYKPTGVTVDKDGKIEVQIGTPDAKPIKDEWENIK